MNKRKILTIVLSLLFGVPLLLVTVLCLGLTIVLNWPCLFPKGLSFYDYQKYGSLAGYQDALLEQIPLGSTHAEVIAFLEEKGFSQQDNAAELGSELYVSPTHISLRLLPCGWSASGYIDIDFYFNEQGRLQDILVDMGPT